MMLCQQYLTFQPTFKTTILKKESRSKEIWMKVIHCKKKKGVNSLTDQKNVDSNMLPSRNEEVNTPDVEMQYSKSTTTSLLSSSDIVVKQEIIETELESSICDDASFHSSIADSSSEAQFEGQRANTSDVAHAESSNSNTKILPAHVVGKAFTQTRCLSAVEVESDVSTNSYDLISENNSGNESMLPGNPSNFSSLPQSSSSLESSRDTESIQSKIPSHSRMRDRFDVFGEFVASKLRNLDSKSIVFIQTTIADLLLKAELGMFQTKTKIGY
ncbi:uncharacterized protein [Parasteatoda tepidariorum]|uniref:uncharacterized protein isoform X1 n=2 Tax=Parasteatoda tepidariorum TaxID=114398 RepID=UPI001C718149|nr:uncharacterized protein LOC107450602 isoform X1 [Parasteatoda tepidariorum]